MSLSVYAISLSSPSQCGMLLYHAIYCEYVSGDFAVCCVSAESYEPIVVCYISILVSQVMGYALLYHATAVVFNVVYWMEQRTAFRLRVCLRLQRSPSVKCIVLSND